jgi:hypothetical protein
MAAVVFQCAACRALGVAHEVVVGVDGSSVGLVCATCAQASWLPVAQGSVTAQARPTSTARALPSSSTSSTTSLPPSLLRGDDRPAEAAAPVVPLVRGEPLGANAAPWSDAGANADANGGSTHGGPSDPFGDDERTRIRKKLATLPPPSSTQAALASRFDALLDGRWRVETEHKALLKAAATAGELAFVGSRYRAVLDVVRDEPRARGAQQELLTMAMATMKPLGSAVDDGPGGGRRGVAAVALVVVFFVVLVVGGSMVRDVLAKLEALGTGP